MTEVRLLIDDDDLPALRRALERSGEVVQAPGEPGWRWRARSATGVLADLSSPAAVAAGVFENNHAVMLLIAPDDGRILDANPAAVRFYGWSREVLRGMRIGDINSLSPERIAAEMASARAEHRWHFRFQHRRADGSVRDVEVFSGPVALAGGEVLCSIVHDVTERLLAERALRDTTEQLRELLAAVERSRRELTHALKERERTVRQLEQSERRYRLLFDANPHPMWTYDVETLAFLSVNDAAVRRYGYSRDEFLGMTLLDIRPEEDQAALIDHVERATGVVQESGDWRHRTRDGRLLRVEIASHAIDWSGRPARLVLANDVTERRVAEERVREQAALLDAANDAIYVLSLDGALRYWNRSAARAYGFGDGAKSGAPAGFADPEARAARDAVLATGTWSGERRHRGADGEERVMFCRWTRLTDDRGRPRGVLAIDADVTAQKQIEAQYLRSQRMEGIGALASGLAHDINNILAPMLMITPLLQDVVTDAESRQLLETVERNAQRGADIIRQLLTFARGVPGARVPLPVQHLLRDMERLLRETLPRDIDVRVRVARGLWPVRGDLTQVHQVLMNLCVNARDAMPAGGVLRIEADNARIEAPVEGAVPSAAAGAYVRLLVADTGVGIPPEQLDLIFDPFFTTKPVGTGTGLGLSTVLGIVRSHDGFVRVRSRIGEGTAFEVHLPAIEGDAAARTEGDGATAAQVPRGRGELVLVVDDEEAVRRSVRRTLEGHGYRVVAAAHGRDGLAQLAEHRGDVALVVTDLMMPVMGGPAMVAAMRHSVPGLPAIGMTGLTDQSASAEALGMSALLSKPFSRAALLEAVHAALADTAADRT